MKKKPLMKMQLQFFAQQFTPDHTKVYENPDGTIPTKHNQLILKEIMENSKMMQLAKYEEMTEKEKTFQYFAEGPGAYWVGETEKIKTSTAKWLTVTMTAKKLGVIVLASREYLQYEREQFFEEMRPKIAEAFYKKIDAATILNVENPFPQSIEESVTAAKNVVKGDLSGDGAYDLILDIEDKLTDNDFEPNAFISTRKNRTALRSASKVVGNTTELIYDRSTNTIDGLPVADLKALPKGEIYTGDFDHMFYGLPYNMTYKISEEAQLSTITNEDGSPVNLFEQEMFAMRVTMDIGFMLVKDGAFAKIQPEAAEPTPEG